MQVSISRRVQYYMMGRPILTARAMTFKAKPNAYCIELATSSRAACRRCRSPIAKGMPRLRITAFVCPGRATGFFRCAAAACLADPRLAAAVVAACGSIERLPAKPTVDPAVSTAITRRLASPRSAT